MCCKKSHEIGVCVHTHLFYMNLLRSQVQYKHFKCVYTNLHIHTFGIQSKLVTMTKPRHKKTVDMSLSPNVTFSPMRRWYCVILVSFPINAPSALVPYKRLNTSRFCSVHSYVPATTKSLILLTTWTKKIYRVIERDCEL